MSISLSPNLPANVVEIGVEIAQAKLDAINNGSSPTSGNPFTTVSYVTGLGYLTSASASALYAPIASPTFTGTVTIPAGASISGYLTTASASSTYQTQAGMTSYAPKASPTFTGTVTIPAGASISGYLTTASAASTYQTQSGMSSYLTTASAASTYQTQSGMSSYLTTASAASTYLTTASASSTYAPLASAVLTGTPSLPTGTIAVTQITSDSSTKIATTAYVTNKLVGYATQTYVGNLYQPLSGMTSYLTTSAASSTYQPIGSYLTDAPNDGSEYVRKNAAWAVATGGGATAASQLTNAVYTTNPTAAPTTAGDVLQFNGSALVWAAAGGGGGGLTISTLSNAATSTLNSTAPTTGQALTFDGTDLIWATVGGGGGATWGSITGTLSTQTDLQTVLDTKLQAKTVNTITSGTYTVQLSDARKVLYLASGGMGFQVQVDNDSSIAYVDGTEITIVVDNPSFGYSVIAGSGPVTVNSSSSGTLTNFVSNLVKVAANTWFVS